MSKHYGKAYTSAECFDAIQELIELGFDLDRNSARDLLSSASELLALKEEQKKKSVQVFYTGGGIWLSAKYVSKHIYAVVSSDCDGVISYYNDKEDIEEDQEFGCFDMLRSVSMDDDDCKNRDRKLHNELLDALREHIYI